MTGGRPPVSAVPGPAVESPWRTGRRSVLLVLIVAVPVVFDTSVRPAFALPKVTVVSLGALLVVVLTVVERALVDSEFFYRVRNAGYRLVLAPRACSYHPAPATLSDLLAKHFLYGAGYAGTVQRHPDLASGRYLRTPLHAAAYVLARAALLVPNVVLPYSHAAPSWRPGFRPLKALTSYAAALGYVYGWYRHPFPGKGFGAGQ